MTGIDAWDSMGKWTEWNHKNHEREVRYKTKKFGDRCRLIKGKTLEVADQIGDATLDFVFIDADHRYEAVKHDTEIALQLLKPDGWIVWHDYANWGYFSGACGVPEYLAEFKKTHSVAQILGSNMAVHRPCWDDSAQAEFEDALAHTESLRGGVWSVGVPRV